MNVIGKPHWLRWIGCARRVLRASCRAAGFRFAGSQLSLRSVARLVVGFVLLLLLPNAARAAHITVVASEGLPAYEQVTQQLVLSLEQDGHQVVQIHPKTTPSEEFFSQSSTDVFVAVGETALMWLCPQPVLEGASSQNALPQVRLPSKARLNQNHNATDAYSQKLNLTDVFGQDAKPPVVFCMVPEPYDLQMPADRAVWGVSASVPMKTQRQLIADALPRVRTIGLLYRSDTVQGRQLAAVMQALMPSDWRLVAVPVNEQNSIQAAINALFLAESDLVWLYPDNSLYTPPVLRALLLGALRHRVPVYGHSLSMVQRGALLGVTIDPVAQSKQAKDLIDEALQTQAKIVQRGGVLELVSPHRVLDPDYEVAINLLLAQQVGLRIDERFVDSAQHIIQEP